MARTVNLKLNPKKTQGGKTEVKFVGHLLTRDGVKPSPERISVQSSDIHRFLGLSDPRSVLSVFIHPGHGHQLKRSGASEHHNNAQ